MIQQKIRKKKRPVLILILKALYSWKKMWSLKILAMLKCESRTSLHVVQCKWHPGMFCSYCFKNGYPRHFFHMLCGAANLDFALSLFLTFLPKSKLLFLKKSVNVCMYFFMNLVDNKQEILEPKLFNIFCYCTFKWIIFVVEILEPTYEQNLLRIHFRWSSF